MSRNGLRSLVLLLCVMIVIYMVLGVMFSKARAEVTTETLESQVANFLYNGCEAQRGGMSVQEVLKLVPKEAETLVKEGYKFGIDYPNVGCNQFFTVTIDKLVKSRSKV